MYVTVKGVYKYGVLELSEVPEHVEPSTPARATARQIIDTN